MEVKTVEVINLSYLGDPVLPFYGQMLDHTVHFTYEFQVGKAYGVIGECGAGGWALSHLLTGGDDPFSYGGHDRGEIRINGQVTDKKMREKYSWYVGERKHSRTFWGLKRKSVLSQLKDGLKNSGRKDYKVEDIIEKFGLTPERLSRSLEQISWERWRAFLAIGFAYGKKIYCFPWCNTSLINGMVLSSIHMCIDALREDGAIIIIPTSQKESVEYFVDEIVYLNNPNHVPSASAREFYEKYKAQKNKNNS